jgi:hypothetical protein
MEEANTKRSQMMNDFRKFLEDAAVQEEEINRILNGMPDPNNALVPFIQPSESPERLHLTERDDNLMVVSRRPKLSLSQRSYNPPQRPKTSSDRASVTSQERIAELREPRYIREPCKLEAWSIDQFTQNRFRIPISHPWLANHLSSQEKTKDIKAMWRRYSKLHSWYKKEIDEIFRKKREDQSIRGRWFH